MLESVCRIVSVKPSSCQELADRVGTNVLSAWEDRQKNFPPGKLKWLASSPSARMLCKHNLEQQDREADRLDGVTDDFGSAVIIMTASLHMQGITSPPPFNPLP